MKLLALGLATVIATLAGSYAAVVLSSPPGDRAATPMPDVEEIVRLEQSSIPILRDGKVQGYVLAQLAFTASASDLKSSKPALTTHVTAAAFATVFEEEALNFASLRVAQLARLGDRTLARANEQIGRHVVRKVLVENLMFLDQESVRCRKS